MAMAPDRVGAQCIWEGGEEPDVTGDRCGYVLTPLYHTLLSWVWFRGQAGGFCSLSVLTLTEDGRARLVGCAEIME